MRVERCAAAAGRAAPRAAASARPFSSQAGAAPTSALHRFRLSAVKSTDQGSGKRLAVTSVENITAHRFRVCAPRTAALPVGKDHRRRSLPPALGK